MKGCAIEGCEQAHYARDWCSMHYRRWRRHGDPLALFKAAHRTEHGTVNEYNNYGCRCDACREAATDARRRRRKRNPEKERAYHREYKLRRRSPLQKATSAVSDDGTRKAA